MNDERVLTRLELNQGKIMNRDYRLTARHHNIVINATSGDDLMNFPYRKPGSEISGIISVSVEHAQLHMVG